MASGRKTGSGRRVLLLGATGLVGGELLDLLLEDPAVARVTAPVRRTSGRRAAKLDEHVVSVKGELGRDLAALGYPSLTIARPSLILGARAERRRGEEWARRLAWLFPPKYKGIHARTIARALVDAAREDAPGVRVLESREMRARYA